MSDLDPSLAYTALLKLWPGYAEGTCDGGSTVVARLAAAMTEANPNDRYSFAAGWIACERAAADVVDADIADADEDLPTLTMIGADVCRIADAVAVIAAAITGPPRDNPWTRPVDWAGAVAGAMADTDPERRNSQ